MKKKQNIGDVGRKSGRKISHPINPPKILIHSVIFSSFWLFDSDPSVKYEDSVGILNCTMIFRTLHFELRKQYECVSKN